MIFIFILTDDASFFVVVVTFLLLFCILQVRDIGQLTLVVVW